MTRYASLIESPFIISLTIMCLTAANNWKSLLKITSRRIPKVTFKLQVGILLLYVHFKLLKIYAFNRFFRHQFTTSNSCVTIILQLFSKNVEDP